MLLHKCGQFADSLVFGYVSAFTANKHPHCIEKYVRILMNVDDRNLSIDADVTSDLYAAGFGTALKLKTNKPLCYNMTNTKLAIGVYICLYDG